MIAASNMSYGCQINQFDKICNSFEMSFVWETNLNLESLQRLYSNCVNCKNEGMKLFLDYVAEIVFI